jgi:anaerobic ribonucleoside-triphosphate reductase activating protein
LSDNRAQTIELCKQVKAKFPNKDIWLWSGYRLDEIISDETLRPALNFIDVLVDGEFIIEKKDLSVPFRGSSNQKIWDIAKWRKTGKLEELKLA